eukprot:2453889-Alexandrium_andersonii.AAC.1
MAFPPGSLKRCTAVIDLDESPVKIPRILRAHRSASMETLRQKVSSASDGQDSSQGSQATLMDSHTNTEDSQDTAG